ncbi:MAG: hypothetical protein PHV30_09165 [Candidatus Margulisbacteria bacterium]|nr:hypothetical protein [Candidatus Margulisiibacteriota bacterium]
MESVLTQKTKFSGGNNYLFYNVGVREGKVIYKVNPKFLRFFRGD